MEEQLPEVVGNSHYEKLWNALDKRELHDFGSTNYFFKPWTERIVRLEVDKVDCFRKQNQKWIMQIMNLRLKPDFKTTALCNPKTKSTITNRTFESRNSICIDLVEDNHHKLCNCLGFTE